MVTIRSDGEMSAAIARSSVVLPAPVPPQMMQLFLANMAARTNSRSARSRVPISIKSSGVTRR